MVPTVLALAIALAGQADAARREDRAAPLAIVTAVKGPAWASTDSAPKHLVSTFDWLGAGTTIEVGRSSGATVIFVNGERYQLDSGARARVTSTGLADRVGHIRQLPTLSPLPMVAPISPGAMSTTSGAVRIRGTRWPMYPSGAATALASATVLRFAPVARAERYYIQLMDQFKAVLFTTTTSQTVASVPTAALEPGRTYTWEVHALDGVGELVSANASFSTLADEQAARRQAFVSHVADGRDPALLTLLGFLDSRLGLLVDARSELRRAVTRGIDWSGLNELLAALDAQLDSIPDEQH